jgi:hypothetical protein
MTFKVVDHEDFKKFVMNYPRSLSADVCGISEPALVGYYDFSAAKGLDALVAKYHQTQNPIYMISEHLL